MNRYGDFEKFCRLQLHTGDYDAHIPTLDRLVKDLRLGRDQGVWMGLLYMGYYSEGSMWAAYRTKGVSKRTVPPPPHLPITTQRRNLYGGRLVRHFNDLYTINDLHTHFGRAGDWQDLLRLLRGVYGNGRWAAYTTGELVNHLGGYGLEPSTFEILESSGPRRGLAAMGLDATEQDARKVHDRLGNALGLDLPASVLESLLCDWGGMCKGTFYAGRNIDRQQGRILQVERCHGVDCTVLWETRRRVFPQDTLGELNGWEGIDKVRLRAYRDLGRVLAPSEDRTNHQQGRTTLWS